MVWEQQRLFLVSSYLANWQASFVSRLNATLQLNQDTINLQFKLMS